MAQKHNELLSDRLGNVKSTLHRIERITGPRTFKYAPYRERQKIREIKQFEINKQLKSGVIEHSVPESAAPVLSAQDKDGCIRLFVDYCEVKMMSIKESYRFPRMDECIDSLGKTKLLKILNVYNVY